MPKLLGAGASNFLVRQIWRHRFDYKNSCLGTVGVLWKPNVIVLTKHILLDDNRYQTCRLF